MFCVSKSHLPVISINLHRKSFIEKALGTKYGTALASAEGVIITDEIAF